MTADELREAAKVMLAKADNPALVVQGGPQGGGSEWADVTVPSWDWWRCRFRVKPAPRLRPLNADELKALVGQVLALDKRVTAVVMSYEDAHVFVAGVYRHGQDLMKQGWTYRDTGKPVGVEVVE